MKRFFSGNIYTWSDSYNIAIGHRTTMPIDTPRKIDLV